MTTDIKSYTPYCSKDGNNSINQLVPWVGDAGPESRLQVGSSAAIDILVYERRYGTKQHEENCVPPPRGCPSKGHDSGDSEPVDYVRANKVEVAGLVPENALGSLLCGKNE